MYTYDTFVGRESLFFPCRYFLFSPLARLEKKIVDVMVFIKLEGGTLGLKVNPRKDIIKKRGKS